jgi:hypothetical protein
MEADEPWAWTDDLDLLEPWDQAEAGDTDDRSPEELATLYPDLGLSVEGPADLGPEAADLAWRAQRAQALEDEGRCGMDLVQAAFQAADGGEDLSFLSDAAIIGRALKCQEVASRARGRLFRSLEELLRRRKPSKRYRRGDEIEERRDAHGEAGPDAPAVPWLPVEASREAASEVALAFTATEWKAETLVDQTADLSRRLPVLFAELEAGRADDDRMRLLWEGTRDLSDAHAARVDALLSRQAAGMTTGELREKVKSAVIRIDPAAADKRRERNEKRARVRLHANPDHTATLAIEQAPAAQAAAAMARVYAIARAAKSGGRDEPVERLAAWAAIGLLLGTLPDIPPGGASGGPADGRPDGGPDGGPDGDGPASGTGKPATGEPAAGAAPWPVIPPTADAAAPGCARLPQWLRPKSQGRAKLQLPWRTAAGMASLPGELSWYGPIPPGQARDLAAAAATDPAVRWQIIVTDDQGAALAVTVLGGRRDTAATGLIDEVTLTIGASLAAGLDSDDPARHWTTTLLKSIIDAGHPELAGVLSKTIAAANKAAAGAQMRALLDERAGGCAHTLEVKSYKVPDTMRRWITARDRTCRNPICRRRAAQSDMDHTRPYDKGGRTCPCDLGPLCRAHHELKQLPGWHLAMDKQGRFTWTTPAGLTYREEPFKYAV